MSSARWRSDSPPTVFDWLIRHWLRKRAALTRPNFGTAINMSKTFAVETYSGGLLRICSIWTRPSLRSFFSRARRTRMSFALFSASIRWSSERIGASAWVLGDTMSAVARCDGRERNRLQRGTGEPSVAGPEHGTKGARVELEAAQRVDEREPVGAGGLGRLGDLADVGYRRRELRPQRLARRQPRRR